MHEHNPSVLAVLAVAIALAGCIGQATDTPAPSSTNAALPSTQGAPSSATATGPAQGTSAAPTSAGGPPALYMTADGALALEMPAVEGSTTMPDPVINPMATAPRWSGTVPADVALPAEVPIVLYVTSSSANLAAKNQPLFPVPGFRAHLTLGNASFRGTLDGPAYVVTGQVAKVEGVLKADASNPAPAAGPTQATLSVFPYYFYATTVAEFRFLTGPSHPSGIVPGSAASSPT